jgi:hypothetical protein
LSAHTPGPWTLRSARLSGDVGIAAGSYDGPIAEVFEELRRGVLRPEVARANARLIAAAPDLLAACEDAVEELRADENYVGDNGGEAEFLVKLRAAIAKARGQ